jgi:catechol 2,3-dioxygenase-like lactoylglutathione lyase family enzyme
MIKVTDLAYARLSAPDLDAMETFLVDFGMIRAARTDSALYMRGTGPRPYVHVTERGTPKFVGMAFEAASDEDLETLARADGASAVEDLDGPGGGKRVRLTDPNGFQVEVVHGIAPVEPLDTRHLLYNSGVDRYKRAGALQRIPKQPSRVIRLGHCGVNIPDIHGTNAWYQDHLGIVTSDVVYGGHEDNTLAIFNRIDGGADYVDHHVFFTVQSEETKLGHIAFEVQDIDDVAVGHDYLIERGAYAHYWGVGRHTLGSQVFDYWYDPWGHTHEHWTDGDVVNDRHETGVYPVEVGLANQWGAPYPGEIGAPRPGAIGKPPDGESG